MAANNNSIQQSHQTNPTILSNLDEIINQFNNFQKILTNIDSRLSAVETVIYENQLDKRPAPSWDDQMESEIPNGSSSSFIINHNPNKRLAEAATLSSDPEHADEIKKLKQQLLNTQVELKSVTETLKNIISNNSSLQTPSFGSGSILTNNTTDSRPTF
jgi:hypothetical protein